MHVSRSLAVTGLSSQPALEPAWLELSTSRAVAHPSHPALRPPNWTGCEEAPVARGVSTKVAVNTVAAVREDDGGFNGDSDHRVDSRVAEWILPAPLITPDETRRFWRLRSPRSVYRYASMVVTTAEWYPD